MSWLLIIVCWGYHTVAVTTTPNLSKDQCLKAAVIARSMVASDTSYNTVFASCIPPVDGVK